MTMRTVLCARAGTALLLAMVGCQGEEKVGNSVSGSVTFKGQPLDQGTIQFDPLENQSTLSGALIEQGRYDIPAERGLAPGSYSVRISSGQPGTAVEEAAPGESGPPAKERIPASFNVETNLKVEVEKDAANHFDFQVP